MRGLIGCAVGAVALAVTSLTIAAPAESAGTVSISGTARAAGSGVPLGGVGVDVIAIRTVGGPTGPIEGPVVVAGATTAADGSYAVTGLDASGPQGYFVCFGQAIASSGVFDSQCWQGADGFDPFPNPFGLVQPAPGSTPIVLGDGQSAHGIDSAQHLDPNATAITGVVHAANGSPLSGAAIDVYEADGSPAPMFPPTSTAGADGGFAFEVARSSAGYFVCVDASQAAGGPSMTGYVSSCFGAAGAWAPGLPPSGQLVASGRVPAATLDISLATGGSVSGTTKENLVSLPIRNVTVDAFDAAGDRLGSAVSDTHGRYRINGLAAGSGYHVCFEGARGKGGIQLHGYRDQCFNHVAWRAGMPVPANAAPVTITAGSVHTGINAMLTPKG